MSRLPGKYYLSKENTVVDDTNKEKGLLWFNVQPGDHQPSATVLGLWLAGLQVVSTTSAENHKERSAHLASPKV